MTVTTNNDQVTVSYTGANGKPASLTIPVAEVTPLLVDLLAARKAAYESVRQAKAAERDAKKAEREAKKAEKTEKTAARKADRIAKLEKALADLKA